MRPASETPEPENHPEPRSDSGRSRQARALIALLPLLPGILLTFVGLVQIHLALTEDLDPWKGGGFGMFSTAGERHVHVYRSDGGKEERVETPDPLEDLADRMRTHPSEIRMEEFSRKLSNAFAEEAPEHISVRIEIWRTQYDPATLSPRSRVIREIGHARAGNER